MGKVKVAAIDKTHLQLLEDGRKGDVIDLTDIQEVDLKFIEMLIDGEKEKSLKARFDAIKAQIAHEKDSEYIKALSENKTKNITELNEQKFSYEKQINELKTQIDSFKEKAELQMSLKEKEKDSHYNQIITRLKEEKASIEASMNSGMKLLQAEIARLDAMKKNEIEIAMAKKEIEYAQKLDELKDAKLAMERAKDEEIKDRENQLSQLKLKKNSLNIKQLGEDLENWCNQEYLQYALVGFENCTWEKDNEVIRNEDESKGSKADYIFKCYASEQRDAKDLLASICCEMKNEALESVNKKRNQDHFDKLDKDRRKKGCEYALLISELEWTNENDAPIKKIANYEKMYLVRPQYFITFLSIIVSLTNKYKALLNQKNIEELKLKDRQTIIEEFTELKNTYLDKPLAKMAKELEEIIKQSTNITKANDIILSTAKSIVDNTIAEMKLKIERFDIRKIERKVENNQKVTS